MYVPGVTLVRTYPPLVLVVVLKLPVVVSTVAPEMGLPVMPSVTVPLIVPLVTPDCSVKSTVAVSFWTT